MQQQTTTCHRTQPVRLRVTLENLQYSLSLRAKGTTISPTALANTFFIFLPSTTRTTTSTYRTRWAWELQGQQHPQQHSLLLFRKCCGDNNIPVKFSHQQSAKRCRLLVFKFCTKFCMQSKQSNPTATAIIHSQSYWNLEFGFHKTRTILYSPLFFFPQRLNSRLRRMRQKNFFKARTAYCTVFLNFKVPFYRMRLYHRMTSAENEKKIQYNIH